MSIVNFEEQIKERPSDALLNILNQFSVAKRNGVQDKEALAKMIILEGALFANKIKEGKVTIDEIESAEAFITGFARGNKDEYFKINHKELDTAAKSFLEGDYVALEELEQRNGLSQVVEQDEFIKGLRRVA